MGELAFRKIQYGKETNKGTGVAATKVWPGAIQVPVDRVPVFPEITSGKRSRSSLGIIPQLLVDGWTLTADPCPFNLLPAIFSMALKGGVTASEVTPAQADYLWDFTPNLVASNSQNAFTIEFGDDTQAYEMEYSMARSVKIEGKLGENGGVAATVEGFSRQITPTTFTSSLSPLAYEYMLANMSQIWIDPVWADLGKTIKAALVQEFSFEILTGLHPKFLADGAKTFSSHGEGYIDCMATFVLEGGSLADAIWDDFQAGTKRAIQFKVQGSKIGTGTNYSLIINMYGQWESVIPLNSEKNGNNLHAAVFHCLDDNQATPHNVGVTCTTNSNTV